MYKILENANKSTVTKSTLVESGVEKRKNLLRMMEMFYIFIIMVVSCVYIVVKSYQF